MPSLYGMIMRVLQATLLGPLLFLPQRRGLLAPCRAPCHAQKSALWQKAVLILALSLLLAWTAGAEAANTRPNSGKAEPRFLGSFRDWNVFILDAPEGPVCWMTTQARRQEGDYGRRGPVSLQLTHRPREGSYDVVSFNAGYPLAANADIMIQIGKQSFKLFASGEAGWARDEALDRTIAQAIRQGTVMMARSVSTRGNHTADTFSLAGSGPAYQAMSDACKAAAHSTERPAEP
jgi:Invasion associated locus B (IalB) protein